MREDGSFATATPAPVPGIIDSFGNMIGFVINQ
jgi:hypothetical protein